MGHEPVVTNYEVRPPKYPDGHWLNPVWNALTVGVQRIVRASWYHYFLRPHPETAARLRAGAPCVFTCTHQTLLDCFNGLPKALPATPLAAMSSKSRDGEIAATLARSLGYRVVRGSSASGGSEALLQMRGWVKQGSSVLFACDGPKAPLGDIKAGIVMLARGTGAPIVPIHAWGSARWQARRSWTRMAFSIPFCPVGIWMGEPLEVDPDQRDNRPYQLQVARVLADLAGEASRWWGPCPRPPFKVAGG